MEQVKHVSGHLFLKQAVEFLEAPLENVVVWFPTLDGITHDVPGGEHFRQFSLSWLSNLLRNYLAEVIRVLGFEQRNFLCQVAQDQL